ncbi:MAG: 3-dehydroquinate synthase [Coriobacteriales bacterium]|nr:3-dehydroquinate synthase [Coriobacteriales bacterium]
MTLTPPLTEYATVRVEASGSYDIVIGKNLLAGCAKRICDAVPGNDKKVLVISDTNVFACYGNTVLTSLASFGFEAHSFVFEAGEHSKNLETYAQALSAAATSRLTRSSIIVALGGGVCGDLAGFVAATYMRGCAFIQIPTSLLAMVDSSVGGKTAVDLPEGKNLVGAFWQPKLVICDVTCLHTLPEYYMTDGMGEVLKYAVMQDAHLFDLLNNPASVKREELIRCCIEIKRDIVEADEREHGQRKLLNLGHTMGHAIERMSSYSISHGRAVAAGMCIMARACAEAGICPAQDALRIVELVKSYGLPTQTEFELNDLMNAVTLDKKRSGTCVDAITIEGIGSAAIKRITLDEFATFIAPGLTKTPGDVICR